MAAVLSELHCMPLCCRCSASSLAGVQRTCLASSSRYWDPLLVGGLIRAYACCCGAGAWRAPVRARRGHARRHQAGVLSAAKRPQHRHGAGERSSLQSPSVDCNMLSSHICCLTPAAGTVEHKAQGCLAHVIEGTVPGQNEHGKRGGACSALYDTHRAANIRAHRHCITQ